MDTISEDSDQLERLKEKIENTSVDLLSEEDVETLTEDCMNLLHAIHSYDNDYSLIALKTLAVVYGKQQEIVTVITEVMIKHNFAEVAVNLVKYVNAIGIFKNDSVWYVTHCLLSNCLSLTDKCPRLCMHLAESGWIPIMLANISHKPYLDNIKSQNVKIVIKLSLGILYNLARIPENKDKFSGADATLVIQPFTESEVTILQALAYLTLAYIVEDSEDKAPADTASITYLVRCLASATMQNRGIRRYKGFTAQELAEGLGVIGVNDANKVQIVEAGALPLFVNMMQYTNPEEQCAAARALWSLSFDKQVKQKIIDEPQCINTLETLAMSVDVHAHKAAKGALWKLKEETHMAGMSQTQTNSAERAADAGHIFISYDWGHQETILKIAKRLKAHGLQVWIDVDKMCGSVLEAMARAVEDAAVVIICMSEKYKLSPNCRTEAEYTFQLKKPVLPLMLQPRYKPDGWLGMILGAKFFINFDGKHTFDEAFSMLIKELKEMGMAAGTAAKHRAISGHEETVLPQPASPGLTTTGTPPPPSMSGWSVDKVADWLSNVGLENVKDKFADYNGRLILALCKVRSEAPQFFYEKLDQMGLSMIDILKMVDAMDDLKT